jgi:hypothetical protein
MEVDVGVVETVAEGATGRGEDGAAPLCEEERQQQEGRDLPDGRPDQGR